MSDTDIDYAKFIDTSVSGYDQFGNKLNLESDHGYVLRKEQTLKSRINDVYDNKSNNRSNDIDSDDDSDIDSDDDSDKNERDFDLYKQYVYERGLDKPHRKKHFTVPICIDSRNRNLDPITNEIDPLYLDTNPLVISGDIIQITTGNNHQYKVDDQITLKDVPYVEKKIKIYSTYASSGTIIKKYAVDIVRSLDDNKKTFMRFDVNPNIDVDTINALSSTGFSQSKSFFLDNNDDNLKYKEYDLSFTDMTVTISGFKTDDESTEIGGIPLNFINTTHRMYLSPRETTRGSSPVQLGIRIIGISDSVSHSDNSTKRSFYIKLPKEYSANAMEKSKYMINITFNHYGGIPINKINAFYPISHVNIYGYHNISKIYTSKIEYKLTRNGYYSGSFGGSNCLLAKLESVISGDTYSNEYSITLDNIYNNIVSSEIIATTFPNVLKTIRDEKSCETPNNRLYWCNDDDTKVYCIEIPEGNYTAETLSSEIESRFYRTQRRNKPYSTDSPFTKNQYIKVNINENTDTVTFKSYKEGKLIKPLRSIDPEILPTETFDSISHNGEFKITINMDMHHLVVGDKVIISGAITTLGIPASMLNTEHIVNEVSSSSSFVISLFGVNLEDVRRETKGGNSVIIYTPNKLSLRFNYPDTIGNVLGFRTTFPNVLVTPYSSIITNDDKYEGELEIDSSGNQIQLRRNKLNLLPPSYIIMWCDELNGIKNNGIIKDIFARINIDTCDNTILLNTYDPVKITYREPIHELKKLTIKYYTPDGQLVDFNNSNHSFIIELTMIDKLPEQSGILPNLGDIN